MFKEFFDIGFRIGNLEFNGLKFKEDKSKYPWKTKKDGDIFIQKLLDKGDYKSKETFKELLSDQIDQFIHINMTYSYLYKFLSMVFIIFALIISVIKISIIISVSLLIFSFISRLIYILKKRKYEQNYALKNTTLELVDIMFYKEN